jgi:cellulose synthase/poly-beta-1,6-N-acetylglucosamine synthase-like glycosyltransferase
LTALAAFVLAWPLAGYPLLLKVITSLRPASAAPPAPTGSTPRLTVIVPTYNEAANIGERLRNIAASNYSAGMLDIIVVDSASADGTADLAETEARSLSVPVPVRVIREPARAGKAAAINRGLAAAQGDVIVVTDAPTVFEPDALTRVSSAFDDPAVGAATGTFVVTGEGGALQRSEQQFWRLRNRLRALEAGVDSTPFLSGELCAFRRDVVPALDEDTLADDMNIALQVRRRGHRCVVV